MSQSITAAQLKAIASAIPGGVVRPDLVAAISRGWPAAVAKAKLTTSLRAAHFLAQIMTETGGLQILEESGSYRAPRIMEIFGVGNHSAGVTAAEAKRFAAMPVAQRGPALFNRAYGVGNPRKMKEFNNTGPNDGWLYRGGGMMQATGKSNYAKMEKKTGLPLVAHPEMLHQPDSAFLAAYLEWAQDGRCNAAADVDKVVAVRQVINGGTNGLAECRKYLAKAKTVLAGYSVAAPKPFFAEPEDVEEAEAADLEPAIEEPAAPELAPISVSTATTPVITGDPELYAVKSRLRPMHYIAGAQNGEYGGMTSEAIAGFITDRGSFAPAPTNLAMFHDILDELKEELTIAENEDPPFTRPVTEARRTGDAATVAAAAPAVVPAKRGFWATIAATIATFLTAVWDTVGGWASTAYDFLTDHKDDLPSTDSGVVSTAMEYVHKVPSGVWWFGAAIALGLLAWNAHISVKKITDPVKSGAVK